MLLAVSLHRQTCRGHGCAQKFFAQRPPLLIDGGMAAPIEAESVRHVDYEDAFDELLGPNLALPAGTASLGVAPALAGGDGLEELISELSPRHEDSPVLGTGQEQEQVLHSRGLFAEASPHDHSVGDAENPSGHDASQLDGVDNESASQRAMAVQQIQQPEAMPVPSRRRPPRQRPQEHRTDRQERHPRSRAKHTRKKQRRPECDREEQEDQVHDAEEREKSQEDELAALERRDQNGQQERPSEKVETKKKNANGSTQRTAGWRSKFKRTKGQRTADK